VVGAFRKDGVVADAGGLYVFALGDPDGDLLFGVWDNCPGVYNPQQSDYDMDGLGDVCDPCPAYRTPGFEWVPTGEVNGEEPVTTADVIYLVNHVFRSGPEPQPIAATGDVNCSGTLNASDIVYLINCVLKGGPAPCDVCALEP